MSKLLALIIGGGAGTLARYFLSDFVGNTKFPYGTMAVNLLGCFLVGMFIVLFEEKIALDLNLRLLLIVGFCGAFTTFSTLILESAHLVRDGQAWLALTNIIGSVIVGFICFKLGIMVGEVI